MKKILFILILVSLSLLAHGEENTQTYPSDVTPDSITTEPAQKKMSAIKRWWESLAHGNIDRTFERPLDITFAAAPFYSQESSFGIGGSVNALYRVNKKDSLMQPSDFSVMGGISVKGTGMVGVEGNQNFTRSHRLSYSLAFKRQVRDLWGFSFEDCYNNPVVNNRYNRILLTADYKQRFGGNWFWGAALRVNFIECSPDSIEYLNGQKRRGFFAGVGPLIQYDSRDYILNPKRGSYFMSRLVYYPSFLTTHTHDVFYLTLQYDTYFRLWQDCILAYDLFCEFNFSNGSVPWQLREEINVDDRRMRGTYTGRYIDDNQMCTQIELRQRLWKRLGAVAWAGVGTLFGHFSEIDRRHILPTYGGGVRFELKANTNLRLDIGFGRDNMAFMLGFGEAF